MPALLDRDPTTRRPLPFKGRDRNPLNTVDVIAAAEAILTPKDPNPLNATDVLVAAEAILNSGRTSIPTEAPKSIELPLSIPQTITSSSEGWVAPKAGELAKEIQTQGLDRKDRILEEYSKTGEYTPDVARSSYNAFMRMAISDGGNILNISGATELPQGVDPNMIMEHIGRKTLGAEAREAARYGRISIMVADVKAVDYAQLFQNFTEATKQVNSEHFTKEKAAVMNGLQDKRASELLADANRARGVVEGTVAPDLAAMGPEAAGKEYFMWSGKREEGTIKGINPDGNWQDQAELIQAPDLITKALLAHEMDLLKSVQEGTIRVIFIGDNEDYVKRCCGSASETQQDMKVLPSQNIIDLDPSQYSVVSTDLMRDPSEPLILSGSAGGGSAGVYRETCYKCGKNKFEEDGCKCSES